MQEGTRGAQQLQVRARSLLGSQTQVSAALRVISILAIVPSSHFTCVLYTNKVLYKEMRGRETTACMYVLYVQDGWGRDRGILNVL